MNYGEQPPLIYWDKILDGFAPDRPVCPIKEKAKAGVLISRSYNIQAGYAVWEKTHKDRSDPRRVFDDWELFLLQAAKNCPGLYKLAASSYEATMLNGEGSRLTLQTFHNGPDLGIWGGMQVRSDNKRSEKCPHAFFSPVNYLRLAKAVLQALDNLYQRGIVHCDIYPSNIVLPAEVHNFTDQYGEGLIITPLWDRLELIDLGYSIKRDSPPWALPPMETDININPRLSIHLRNRLIQIREQTKAYLKQGAPHLYKSKPIAYIESDRTFWESWIDSPLSILNDLDWREDLFQLGYLLLAMRGSRRLLPQSRPPHYCWEYYDNNDGILCRNPHLHAFIVGSEDEKQPGLAERLLAWGDDEQWSIPASDVAERPHQKLITTIDEALKHRETGDENEAFVVYRIDHDLNYRDKWQYNKFHGQGSARQSASPGRRAEETEIPRISQFKQYIAYTKSILQTVKGWAVRLSIQGRARFQRTFWRVIQWRGFRPVLTAGLVGLGVWQIQENYGQQIQGYGQQIQAWYEHRKNRQRWHGYLQSTQSIQQKNQKNWWNGDRAANALELVWLQETRDLAKQGMPFARIQWTILGCYGMQGGSLGKQLNEVKASTCGREIGAALRLAAQAHASIPDMMGWPAILEDTRSLLQRTLYADAWGLLAPPAQANANFALALLDGLESVAAFDDFLAYAMADIQACWLKPAQTEAAQRTLQALVDRFLKTELAEKARGDLSQHLNSFCAP
jgi:serine/threonine protein kinase